MKVYAVMDGFHGTFETCSCYTVSSLWFDKNKAQAIADAGYGQIMEEFEIRDNEVPRYALESYEKLIKKKSKSKKV